MPQKTLPQKALARTGLVIGLVWLVFFAASPALAAPKKPAAPASAAVKAFVQEVNQASVDLFASGSEAEARAKCKALLAERFDVLAMGEYALGQVWAKTSKAKRKEYLQAFEDEIVTAYLRRMHVKGITMTYIGRRPPLEGDVLAASRVVRPGKEDQTWIWRLHPEDKSWRIVDVLVDGHSAIFAESQTYHQILQANQGDIDAVIAYIRKQAARGLEPK